MEERLPVLLAGLAIGEAIVTRRGLYAYFDCRCQLSGQIIYRLTVDSGSCSEILGIPVPEDGHFVLRTRLPLKRLEPRSIHIRAVPKKSGLSGKLIPLSPEEPFSYISRLQNAFLETQRTQPKETTPEDIV